MKPYRDIRPSLTPFELSIGQYKLAYATLSSGICNFQKWHMQFCRTLGSIQTSAERHLIHPSAALYPPPSRPHSPARRHSTNPLTIASPFRSQCEANANGMRNQKPSNRPFLTQSGRFCNIPSFRNLPVVRTTITLIANQGDHIATKSPSLCCIFLRTCRSCGRCSLRRASADSRVLFCHPSTTA